MRKTIWGVLVFGLGAICAVAQTPTAAKPKVSPTVAEARAFVAKAEKRLEDLGVRASRADWVNQNFITSDTEKLSADAQEALSAAVTELASAAKKFEKLDLPADLKRKLWLIKISLPAPAPSNEAERRELTELAASMQGDYGRGKYCPHGPDMKCFADVDIIKMMATSRDADLLLTFWDGWHQVGAPLRQRYARFVELSNKGAREMGFADAGAMWRSNYDMPPDEFAKEMDRLWLQVKPLYDSLHAYVRGKLIEKYGADARRADGLIPAHLLGNIWAQQWNNVYDIVKPPTGDPGFDLTKILVDRKTDEKQLVRYGESFFTSLGFAPLPKTFWERSLFSKPADRDVICHASAWDVDSKEDLRLKMCIDINEEDFTTVHHELGHNFYQRAYNKQSFLFQGSANDGFHEALGDTIALSVTPEYLRRIGFLEKVPPPEGDLGLLMQRALEKIAFLPFGLMVDKWRWQVFSGETKPADYNRAWWELKRKYQGVIPPAERNEEYFDAAAKYHVAANVPYARYFLADILQFQFFRAMCKQAGYTGPLHRCSFYGNKPAGEKLNKMLEMGLSKPWPDALEALTGEKKMDASAILEYFAPLKKWLDEENRKSGNRPGW